MKKHLYKGFTIIELIVVIATIAVLAAVIISNVNQYAAKARDAKRAADTKNILKALMMFQADNGCVPITYGGGTCPGVNGYAGADPAGWDYSSQGAQGPSTPFLPFLVSGGYLKVVPVDPINNMTGDTSPANTYAYRYYCYPSGVNQGMHLGYWRESGGWAEVTVNGGGFTDSIFVCK